MFTPQHTIEQRNKIVSHNTIQHDIIILGDYFILFLSEVKLV